MVFGDQSIEDIGNVVERKTILFNETSTHYCYINNVFEATLDISQYEKANDNHLMLFATSGYEPNYGTSNSRIYFCRIKEGGILVRDFRPIAIGNTGYMMDILTGDYLQYGNKGTGDFVLGPDAPPPTI